MRKNLTKAISTTLAAAMVVTAGGFAGVANTNGSTAKAADPTASCCNTCCNTGNIVYGLYSIQYGRSMDLSFRMDK